MDQSNKYQPPAGPPPNYPQSPPPAQHYDAGPYQQGQWQQPGPWGPQQGYGYDQYGNSYGPPQPGYYGPQGPMQYQQGPPQGYYMDDRRGMGAGEGCCAALLGALACCCCLDLLF